MVNELLEQITPLLAVTVGVTYTVRLLMAEVVLVHPAAFVPEMEYVVFTTGLTVKVVPGKVLFNVYVTAPAGVNVNTLPVHIEPVLAVITGLGITVTVAGTGNDIQPTELIPVTVYVVVVFGDTSEEPPEYV
jgi:hypothetical protein